MGFIVSRYMDISVGSLTMKQMEAVPKSLVGWGHNCFCSGPLFWASFWISLLETKLTYLVCAKSLFLASIFIKFFTNTHYDFKLPTKRKVGHVIILLCSGKGEIPNSKEKERNGVLKLIEKNSLTLIQLLLWRIFLPFFSSHLFPIHNPSSHKSTN